MRQHAEVAADAADGETALGIGDRGAGQAGGVFA